MNWTENQKSAIYEKNSNILVAAAAGSGKTAVLVERIIQKILKDNVDIDRLLVVTFTNAAASEMRERVLEAIYKKLDEEPENENLQKQIVLLGKSNICTIHSFCLDVIKNNFFEIDLSANFRIGSEEEIELLKQEVLEDFFEELYEKNDEKFIKLVNTYTNYIDDNSLKEMILRIYKFMQSFPFPRKWLEEKVEFFNNTGKEDEDFSKSIWGKILIKDVKEEILDSINSLKIIRNNLAKYEELENYTLTIEDDISKLREIYEKDSWDKLYDTYKKFKFIDWPRSKKIVSEVKEKAKNDRTDVKDKILANFKKTLVYDSKSAFDDIYEMYEILNILKEVIFEFEERFKAKKKEKNIIDFNDIEHYALKILVKEDENGKFIQTDVAKKYQEKFIEIAIDEYQDSNQVQEFILKSVSSGNNLFMVGDVKQSIYKFRQACPKLFLEKYGSYSKEGNENGLKIQLFQNFRSRKNILDITNNIFKSIMSQELGDIDYNEEEYLNFGADFEELENGVGKSELNIIDLCEEPIADEEEGDFKRIEKEEIEAEFVAQKIEELISAKKLIKDKKEGIRPIKYKDIVILLRSTANLSPIYEKALLKKNIPVFSDSSDEYLDTIEIQTIINVLKILDNPIDDIALVSVLRSEIGNFTDNEIVEIRLVKQNVNFYESLKEAKEKITSKNLKEKISKFLENIENWRKESDYLSLAELIWKIYVDTSFYNYVGLMPNGLLRQANLKMLFERAKDYEKTSFKGLFNFIRFIDKLKSGNSDMSSAKIIGENENVVRIMSIHKSKGLEFPVVFLSSTGKRFNMQDLNSNLLLHDEVGLGPQYINYEKMIEYSTSAKDAIKVVAKEEIIAEEMRVLYVALTRAKEKLIITGVSKDYKEEIESKKEKLQIYNQKSNKINPILLKKYISYLGWIELALLSKKLEDLIDVKIIPKNDIKFMNDNEETNSRNFEFNKECDLEKYDRIFNFKYEDEFMTSLPLKTTVSKIKEMKNNEIPFENLISKEIGIENITPKFLETEEKISASKKGSLMHLFLQNIDFKAKYDLEKLSNLKKELISQNIITQKESEFINLNKIMNFLNSPIAQKIYLAKKIEKEKAFCMKMPAKEIFENAEKEYILVQGIIDLYAIDENNNIILVDYKTDFIKDEEIFKNLYLNQLKLYKQALEKSLKLKVKEVYIYSTYLEKEILIDII